jgi:hypothetical protein
MTRGMTPTSYEQALAQVAPGSLDEAGLHYDIAFMTWCFELNREPSLSGHFLTFDDWDAFDRFAATLPPRLDFTPLLEKAASLYEALYEGAVAAGDRTAAVDLGLKLTTALDKLVGQDERIRAIEAACLEQALAADDQRSAGSIYLSQAHTARYRTYDAPLAFELLHRAQGCFRSVGDKDLLHRAYLLEMSILDPETDYGSSDDIHRYRELYALCIAHFQGEGNHTALVEVHIAGYQRFESFKRLDLVEEALLALLEVVRQHAPDDYPRNRGGVQEIFESLGLDVGRLPPGEG